MIFRHLLICAFSLVMLAPALAQDAQKPDDFVSFDLSAEDWVTTKTAHVAINVEAAVSATSAGSVRADMIKSVNDAAKADWRLTAFSRTQDQTGMERWSVTFEARVVETELNGLGDALKKASKAGMQMTIGDIDFTPTLDETELVRSGLREHLLKEAAEQLTTVNAALPGRTYRIAQVTFESTNNPMPRVMRKAMMLSAAVPSATETEPEHAQKLALNAHIVLAALPPSAPR